MFLFIYAERTGYAGSYLTSAVNQYFITRHAGEVSLELFECGRVVYDVAAYLYNFHEYKYTLKRQ